MRIGLWKDAVNDVWPLLCLVCPDRRQSELSSPAVSPRPLLRLSLQREWRHDLCDRVLKAEHGRFRSRCCWHRDKRVRVASDCDGCRVCHRSLLLHVKRVRPARRRDRSSRDVAPIHRCGIPAGHDDSAQLKSRCEARSYVAVDDVIPRAESGHCC
jgi:hypothetical protein